MSLTNEHVGSMILAKIKIYVFTRAELLFQVCYETPCSFASSSFFLCLRKIMSKTIQSKCRAVMFLRQNKIFQSLWLFFPPSFLFLHLVHPVFYHRDILGVSTVCMLEQQALSNCCLLLNMGHLGPATIQTPFKIF